jgi:hypothetical protein
MLDVCFSVKPLSKKLLEIQEDTNLFGTRMIFCSRVSGYRLLFFVASSILVTFVFSAIAFPLSIFPTQALPKVMEN